MLYFTKLNVVITYCFIILISFFTFSNFLSNENNIVNKKINLGLDLQGGSYLLLEMDIDPIVLQKLQNKLIPLKKNLINNKIKFKNIKISEEKINLEIESSSIDKFIELYENKENGINTYLDQYKSFEFDYTIDEKKVSIFYSKFGIGIPDRPVC